MFCHLRRVKDSFAAVVENTAVGVLPEEVL